MSDKPRAYSDSAGTLIIKGSSMAEILAFMQEACGMAEELHEANEHIRMDGDLIGNLRAEIATLKVECADLQRQNALLHAELLRLRGVVSP